MFDTTSPAFNELGCGTRYGEDLSARVVRETAKDQGIDIGVRIGVHTGMVVGGIIGTVRFHFDMWGNGVIGAMKMEEMGTVGRVHISDATAKLIGDSFRITSGREQMEPKFVDSYGISSSSFIYHLSSIVYHLSSIISVIFIGCSWALLGRAWAALGRSWATLGHSWAALGCSWTLLGCSWL